MVVMIAVIFILAGMSMHRTAGTFETRSLSTQASTYASFCLPQSDISELYFQAERLITSPCP